MDEPELSEWGLSADEDIELAIEPVIIDAKAEPEEAVKQLMRSAAPFAARTIIEIAKGRKESRIQFDAAKYVVGYVTGENADPDDTIAKQFGTLKSLLLESPNGTA